MSWSKEGAIGANSLEDMTVRGKGERPRTVSSETYLRHDDQLFARQLELFDCATKHDLRQAVRVQLRSRSAIPRDSVTPVQLTSAVSKVLMPWSKLQGIWQRARVEPDVRGRMQT